MLRSFLIVGLGGAFGSMARYGISYAVSRIVSTSFPLGTFLINILGCFIIGLLFGYGEKNEWLDGYLWLLLASGFCGGFTTFSTFALDNVSLADKQEPITALIYTLLSVVLGLILCRVGIRLAQ